MDYTDSQSHMPTLRVGGATLKLQGMYMRQEWFPKGKFRCCSLKQEWLLCCKINTCPLHLDSLVRINSVLPPPAHRLDICTSSDFFLLQAQASSHPSFLGTRSLILQSTWVPSHALTAQQSATVPLENTPSRWLPPPLEAELSHCDPSQLSTNLESASRSHCLPSSWLWRTPGPGDTGLTGEIIMFYPSLTSLSVSQTRTDKCSDARKHFCGIYLCSLVLAGSPFPGTTPRDQPAPCYLVPVTTRCCSLVNCQTVPS